MIENWQPENSLNTPIHKADLNELLEQLKQNQDDFPNTNLVQQLPDALFKKAATWIKNCKNNWQDATIDLNNDEIWLLAKFYALAEEQSDAFSAQEKSPTIVLFKLLKSRGANLSQVHTQELKSLTSNRYIPFGKIAL